MTNETYSLRSIVAVTVATLVMVAVLFFGLPLWNVWRKGLSGEAVLREAEWSRKVAVQEAQAKMDSAKLLAQSEVERARGVAEANRIVADGLKGHEEYLKYLWITERVGQGVMREVVYVPTEANIPILEAARLRETGEQK